MRVLLLTHGFNCLTQRLHVELRELGHEVAVEFDVNDRVTVEAAELFRPELILAPYLRRRIPRAVYEARTCIVLHPGIVGDRGPSALDWAILEGEERWGVTAIEAVEELDGGPVWAAREFPMRPATKSSLYRNEVTEAAVACVREVLDKLGRGDFHPRPVDPADPEVRGRPRRRMLQRDRRIDWQRDDSAAVLRKIRSADGQPGVRDTLCGHTVRLYDAHPAPGFGGEPGALLARRAGAVCRATRDGAVWIGHLRDPHGEHSFKLPATVVLGDAAAKLPEIEPHAASWGSEPEAALPGTEPQAALSETVPEAPLREGEADAVLSEAVPEAPLRENEAKDADPQIGPQAAMPPGPDDGRELRYRREGAVGVLDFAFHNGAMGTAQCQRLAAAIRAAGADDIRVLLLRGGEDFWSNGIHLHLIEAAESPADESMRNIEAIDDVALEILRLTGRLTVAALRGNAGAGGVFLALAADRVIVREGAVLNPHYKSMGNLYGSEYWTYLLPRRVGEERARELMQGRLPLGASQALRLGLIDDCLPGDPAAFGNAAVRFAQQLAANPHYDQLVTRKAARRATDEAERPLAAYRAAELEHLRLNFYGFDPSYHVARYNFVHRVPHSRTPLHLAPHR